MNHWLTRIAPDPRSRDARREATDAVALHQRLMALFPQAPADTQARAHFGVLHRTEDTLTGHRILLQSSHQPDLTRLPDTYGTALTRPLAPLLNALQGGLTIRYRCVASAIRKPGATTRTLYNLPPVVALKGAAADEWWLRQAETAGLKVLSAQSQPMDTAHGIRDPRGDGNTKQRIMHARTRFDGTAVITDTEALRIRITTGIGRGKAYGCGLLSIAPAPGTTK